MYKAFYKESITVHKKYEVDLVAINKHGYKKPTTKVQNKKPKTTNKQYNRRKYHETRNVRKLIWKMYLYITVTSLLM